MLNDRRPLNEALAVVDRVMARSPEGVLPDEAALLCRECLRSADRLPAQLAWPFLESAVARPDIRVAVMGVLQEAMEEIMQGEIAANRNGPRGDALFLYRRCGGQVTPEAWVTLYQRYPELASDPRAAALAHDPSVPTEAFFPCLPTLWTQAKSDASLAEALLLHGPRALVFLRTRRIRQWLLKRMAGTEGLVHLEYGDGCQRFLARWVATMDPREWNDLLGACSDRGGMRLRDPSRLFGWLERQVAVMAPEVVAACPTDHPVILRCLADTRPVNPALPEQSRSLQQMYHDITVEQIARLEAIFGRPLGHAQAPRGTPDQVPASPTSGAATDAPAADVPPPRPSVTR